MLLAWYLNLVSVFVAQESSKWGNSYLVYSVNFAWAATKMPNTTSMVGLTALE